MRKSKHTYSRTQTKIMQKLLIYLSILHITYVKKYINIKYVKNQIKNSTETNKPYGNANDNPAAKKKQ